MLKNILSNNLAWDAVSACRHRLFNQGIKPMRFNRYSLLLASLTLLSACGDGTKQPAAKAPEAPAEATAPMAATAATLAGEVAAAGTDAASLYAHVCAACHGATAEGVGDSPSLAKLSGATIQSRLQAYRAGEKVGPKSAIMAPIAKQLSDEQIAALASYLGN
jgi:cytochrome c553